MENMENMKNNSIEIKESSNKNKENTETVQKSGFFHNMLGAYHLIKTEGFSCLYNGLSSALTGQVLCNAIWFCSYNISKESLMFLKDKNFVLYSILTSGLASAITVFTTQPIWTLNSRMSKSKEMVSQFNK